MAEVIYDKSKASSQSTVKLEDGRFVRAENVVAVAGEGGGGSGGSTTASNVSVDTNGMEVITESNVQSALSQLDAETAKLVRDSSILTTWIDMSEGVGGTADIALRDLQIISDLDSRPSYKEVGAVVINGGQRVIGIIDQINRQVPDEWDESGFADHAIVKTIFVATQTDVSGFEKKIPWDRSYTGDKVPWIGGEQKLVLKTYNELWEGKFYVYLKTCRKATNADNTSLATNTQTKFIDIITRFDFEIDGEGNVINQKASLISPLAGSDWQNPFTVSQNCDGLGFARLEDLSGYIFSSCKGNSVFSTDFFMNATDGESREIFAWTPIMDANNDSPAVYFEESSLIGDIWNAPEGGGALYQSVPVGLPLIKGIGDFATGQGAIYGDFGEGKILQFQDNLFFNRASAAAENLYFGGAHVMVARATILRYDQETGQYSYAIVEFSAFPEKVESKVIDATGEFANVNWEFAFKWYSNFSTGGLTPYGLEVKPTSIFLSYTGNANGYKMGGYITDFYDYPSDPAMRFPVMPLRVAEDLYLEDDTAVNILPQCGGMVLISGVKTVGTIQPDVAEGNIVINLPFPMDTIVDEFTNEETFRKYYPQISVMTDGTFKQIIADIGELRADSFDVCLRNIDTEAANDVKISWSVLAKVPRYTE